MNTIAEAIIEGPEARAKATFLQTESGQTIELQDYWVAQGAPDVHMVLSDREDGQPDDNVIEISAVPDGNHDKLSFELPDGVDLSKMKTVIIFCKQYFAHFGHGTIKVN